MMKNRIQKILKKSGFELHRVNGRNSFLGALKQLKRQGVYPSYTIDGGASDGRWTREAQKCFPKSKYILIEPLKEHRPSLEQTPHYRLVFGALAAQSGIVPLYVPNEFNSSILSLASNRSDSKVRTVDAYMLDDIMRDLDNNILLKLDLEGAELHVLGHTSSFNKMVGVILECCFFSFEKDHVLFREVCDFMKRSGFVVQDLFTFNYGLDGRLMQADVLFVPETSPLRKV